MKKNYDSAIKFNIDTNNEKQLEIAYREIEAFLQAQSDFNFYHKLTTDIDSLYPEVAVMLHQEEK